MKFSIVICTYNGEKTLARVLDSVLKLEQKYELLQETIVVDNNSIDKTKSIIDEYIKKDSTIKYIFEAKQGLSNARRNATRATGDWVIYVDDDNILDTKWLVELKDTITKNSNAGVINGAVVGLPQEKFNESEEIRFKLMYRNLACTHLNSIDFPAEPNNEPIGAGMCIIKKAIDVIDQQGWLKLEGRKGENLSSGEDTELCNKVFKQGYGFVSNYKMIMFHLIPSGRVQEQYIDKLLEGLIKGRYCWISEKKMYIAERFVRYIKYLWLARVNKNWKNEQDSLKQEEKREKYICAKTFISCVNKDRLIRK